MNTKAVGATVAGGAVLTVMAGIGSLLYFNGQVGDWLEGELRPTTQLHQRDIDQINARLDGVDARIQGIIGTLNTHRADSGAEKTAASGKRNDIENRMDARFDALRSEEALMISRVAKLEEFARWLEKSVDRQ